MINTLHIRKLELNVNLGWRTAERSHEQAVQLDMKIQFSSSPKACETDHLEDTVCYDDLITEIRKHISTRHYHLIEHLTADIYRLAKPLLPSNSKLKVRITKHPKIDKLIDGVSFDFGDE